MCIKPYLYLASVEAGCSDPFSIIAFNEKEKRTAWGEPSDSGVERGYYQKAMSVWATCLLINHQRFIHEFNIRIIVQVENNPKS